MIFNIVNAGIFPTISSHVSLLSTTVIDDHIPWRSIAKLLTWCKMIGGA